MTKEEKIKEAYGNKFEEYKPDSEGWSAKIVFEWDEVVENDFMTKSIAHGMYKVRPKSLQGIENNNGWIKIESEADFPKEDFLCYVWNEDVERVEFAEFELESKRFFVSNYKNLPTHYKPIQKPEPPIY